MGRLYYGNTTDGIEIPDRELAPGIVVLWGAQDTEHARIHASDESVDPAELERLGREDPPAGQHELHRALGAGVAPEQRAHHERPPHPLRPALCHG